jgi:uncharacterized membrane protein (DUF2068 family)
MYYKFGKGGLQLFATVLVFALLARGSAIEHLTTFLHTVRQHLVGAWSLRAADALIRVTTPHRLHILGAALGLDGLLSAVEGYALHRRHWWGPWLVVVATASLVPYEVLELRRHLHMGRIVLLVLNLGIVVYLGRRALLEHRARARAARAP